MLKKLNEYMDIEQSGIFSNFENPIWCDAFPDAVELDNYFYLNYGERYGFYTIMRFYTDPTTGKVTDAKMRLMSKMLYNVNAKKWEHLFNVYQAEYNPIENTDFIEEVKEDNGRTSSTTGNTSGTTTTTGTSSMNDNRYGFNSSNAVGDKTHSGSSSDTATSSGTSSATGTESEDKMLERRKHGNIGITENVTMLAHEVEFWKWSFIDQICKDICDIIALSIY